MLSLEEVSNKVMVSRQSIRFMWSHELLIHRMAIRFFNKFASLVPFRLKYALGKVLRQNKYPYKLIRPDSVIVQIGAPQDTLKSGRSRGMYFTLFSSNSGQVFIVEPDSESVNTWQKMIKSRRLNHVTVCRIAVWAQEEILKLYINDAHPASNFTGGTKDHYTDSQLEEYRVVELPADSLDNILAKQNTNKVDIVSITTNGAERKILMGMSQLIKNGLPYICLAVTGDGYVEMMKEFGYKLLAHDERGFTFEQVV